jgi:hypothetical protein
MVKDFAANCNEFCVCVCVCVCARARACGGGAAFSVLAGVGVLLCVGQPLLSFVVGVLMMSVVLLPQVWCVLCAATWFTSSGCWIGDDGRIRSILPICFGILSTR